MIVAIVPAAGQGSRMGRPKLTLSLGGATVIARVVSALREGGIEQVFVVTPPSNEPDSRELGTEASRAGATILLTEIRPIDMRGSVEHALAHVERTIPETTWIVLTPADAPGITAAVIALLVKAARIHPEAIVAPIFAGKRGHPIVMPWRLAVEIRDLPAGVGVNALLKRHEEAIREIAVGDDSILDDLDTPEDYARWNERLMSDTQEIIVRDNLP